MESEELTIDDFVVVWDESCADCYFRTRGCVTGNQPKIVDELDLIYGMCGHYPTHCYQLETDVK